jgi:predicted Zn-dependent peptidase
VTGAIELPLDVHDLSFESGSGTTIRRTVHPSGLRILSEQIPGAMSATIGYWVGVGSRDEDHIAYGSTHFLEHLLFKGTSRRSALDIAVAFDQVGGEHNALTAKEYTCYYAKVQDDDLPMAIDVLADMVAASVIDTHEFDIERSVILEELAMADDDPSNVAHERLAEQVLGDHPLGRPIGGSPQSILNAGRDQVLAYYHRYYRPDELVVTVAGSLDHDRLVDLVIQSLREAGWDLDTPEFPVHRRPFDPAIFTPGQPQVVISRPLEQAVVTLGMPGLRAGDPDRAGLGVLTTVLGGGMSSRLFQEIREKRGLAYSVYAFASQYADTGMVGMAAGTSPDHAAEVVALMRDELVSIAEDGITADELTRTVGNIKGATALALEGTEARMMRLGKSELITGEFLDRAETVRRLDALTLDDVHKIAQSLVSSRLSATAVGPLDDRVFSTL